MPLLTQAREGQPSFHVVTFSLPGFGFSEAPKKKGFSIAQYAEVRICTPIVLIQFFKSPVL